MYPKLALVSIDEHKYSKGKYSGTSAQAALSSKEPLLHTPVPTDQLSNNNWTQGHLSYARQESFHSFPKTTWIFFVCCILERKSRGWDAWKVWLWWAVLFSVLNAGYTPEGWRPHTYSLQPLTCQCNTFTGQSSQHTPASALVLHKQQQGHFISHLALYKFIALKEMPSIKRCCRKPQNCKY